MSTHAIEINTWRNSSIFLSLKLITYYSGFREADFLDFYFFYHTQMFLSLHQFATKNEKPTTMFLFCCWYRNSQSLPLLFSICDINKNKFKELWTSYLVFSHRLRNKNFVKTQQCKWRWSKQLDTYGRHWTEVNSAKSEIIIKVIYPEYSKHYLAVSSGSHKELWLQ